MKRIDFPERLDQFTEHYDPSSGQSKKIARWQTLKQKENRTQDEEQEYKSLTSELRPFIFTAEDLNKMQDAIVGMEDFILTKTVGQINEWKKSLEDKIAKATDSITAKKNEYMQDLQSLWSQIKNDVQIKTNEFRSIVSTAESSIESIKNSAISTVNTKVSEAKQNIESIEASASSSVNGMVNSAKTQVTSAVNAAKQDISTTKDGAIKAINDYGNTFSYKGEWNNTAAYKKNNNVTYNGSVYLALVDNQNSDPETETNKWQKVANKGERGAKGDKGDPGIGTTYKGIYNHEETYGLNDMVSYKGELYCCTSHSSTGAYPSDASKWDLLVAKGKSVERSMFENTVVGNAGEAKFDVGITGYNHLTDKLLVYADGVLISEKNNLDQTKGYTLQDGEVTFNKPLDKKTLLTFMVEKNVLSEKNYARKIKRGVQVLSPTNGGNWVSETGGFSYEIIDDELKGSSDVDVIFTDQESLEAASTLGVRSYTKKTKDNSVTIYSDIPANKPLIVDLVIWCDSL